MMKARRFGYAAVSVLVTVALLCFGFFLVPLFLPRLGVSFSHFLEEAKASFLSLGKPLVGTNQGVSSLLFRVSSLDSGAGSSGLDLRSFPERFVAWGWLLINGRQTIEWLLAMLDFVSLLTRGIMVFAILVILFKVLDRLFFSYSPKRWSHKSFALVGHERAVKYVYRPIVSFFRDWWEDASKGFWLPFWGVLLAFFLSVPAFALDFVGFYLYFFSCADLLSPFDFVLSLVWTVVYDFRFVPSPVWAALALWVVYRIDCKHADREICSVWESNVSTVEKGVGTFTLNLGKMRTGKTYLATMLAILMQIVYHRNAKKDMDKVKMMFPRFPFVYLERCLDSHIRLPYGTKRGRIVNITQAAGFVYSLFLACPDSLFGYDLRKERAVFSDSVSVIDIRDALAIYAQSYFVYSPKSSLICGDYSIRTDEIQADLGHSKEWDQDLCHRDPFTMWDYSVLSHVVLMDSFRFGKKINSQGRPEDYLGAMIVTFSEYGKEVGTSVTNSLFKQSDDVANPKNDMEDVFIKMGGHLTQIWHTQYFHWISDEQRSGSLAANLVDVAQNVYYLDPKNYEERTALRLWWVVPFVLQWLLDHTSSWVDRYEVYREDQTLIYAFMRWLRSYSFSRLETMRELYCYRVMRCPTCSSDASGNLADGDPDLYYDVYRVMHPERYGSAFLQGFLNDGKNKARKGFFDLPEFGSIMPTKKEFDFMRSYMVMDLEGKGGRNNGGAK